MAGEREDKGGAPAAQGALLETQRADAFPIGAGDEPDKLVELHRKVALRLLREGDPGRAFAELVQASRAVPMTRRLAAAVVAVALQARAEGPATTLLTGGLEDTEGSARIDIRRHLIRLLRKGGELERAREELVMILAEKPGDRRARLVLNTLLDREQRWEELDASLEREVKDHLRRGALVRAARATLARARLWGDRLMNHAHAAVRYGQAAQYLEQARDFEGAFNLRVLGLRSLREASAPAKVLLDEAQECIRAGERVGKGQRARTLVREMGLLTEGALDPFSPVTSPPTPPERHATQKELLAAAEEAEARGKGPEATALFTAAASEAPDPAAVARLEAHYVARGAWRELATFYRVRASQVSSPSEQAELLGRLAEVLEDELDDKAGAGQAYGEIVQLTGDRRALIEQVRLLSAQGDFAGVSAALDTAVALAPDLASRAGALVTRGETRLAGGDRLGARSDLEEALRLAPSSLLAMAGLAELAAAEGVLEPVRALRDALAAMPRRAPGRVELFRRLAHLTDGPLKDTEMSSWAWSEVLLEAPQDPEAQRRVAEIARDTGDDAQLEHALRTRLTAEPRGVSSRTARMELAALLERLGRADDAFAELRQAVELEPGHREAWLALNERCVARGLLAEAAWALEQAAAATEDEGERLRTWERLAEFCRERLNDTARADVYTARAERLRQSQQPQEKLPRLEARREPGATPQETSRAVGPDEVTGEVQLPEPAGGEATVEVEPKELDELDLEVTTGEMEVGEMGIGVAITPREQPALSGQRADENQKTDEIPLPEERGAPPPASPRPEARAPPGREALLQRIRDNPLESRAYHDLAELFDAASDTPRCALMDEIAAALDGAPAPVPPLPRLLLSATDRASLRHPSLRGELGELLGLAGTALCGLYPVRGRAAGLGEFQLEAGPGAPAVADALLGAVRVLGLRAPDVYLSNENGPPISLVFARAPRLLVGKAVVKRKVPEVELRFFAGRALFTQNPDLLALRCLEPQHLERGLELLHAALRESKPGKAEVRALRAALPEKSLARLRQLAGRLDSSLDLDLLEQGARHSANRAGLVVCGGVAPALEALRAKRALADEMAELILFAASERYLELRTRRLE